MKLACAIGAACAALCSPPSRAADVSGASDHPLLTRYPGSEITNYRQSEYDEYKLAVGKQPRGDQEAITKRFAGKATTIIYRLRGKQSALQVFRNYEHALNAAGITVQYSCLDHACGIGLPLAVFRGGSREAAYRTMNYDSVHTGTADFGYLSATGMRNGVSVAVGAYVARLRSSDSVDVGLDIVEGQALQTGLIAVSAESLQRDIKTHGKATLDGIYFDTDTATISTKSAPALAAIATYLKRTASGFWVVGHTDNVGSYDHNLDLSRRRAQAVVEVLVRQHSVAASRLIAVGVGPVVPAAVNDGDAGRAHNRRVELVSR